MVKSRKAQHEIIGFVVIVIVMIVIGVIFLSLSLNRQTQLDYTDAEISRFLSSSLKYTSDCGQDYETDFISLGDLVSFCYGRNRQCYDSRNVCDVAQETYSQMLDNPSTWKAGDDRPIKYYSLAGYYQEDLKDPNTRDPPFLVIEAGNSSNCPIRRAGREVQSEGGGDIIIQLEICQIDISNA